MTQKRDVKARTQTKTRVMKQTSIAKGINRVEMGVHCAVLHKRMSKHHLRMLALALLTLTHSSRSCRLILLVLAYNSSSNHDAAALSTPQLVRLPPPRCISLPWVGERFPPHWAPVFLLSVFPPARLPLLAVTCPSTATLPLFSGCDSLACTCLLCPLPMIHFASTLDPVVPFFRSLGARIPYVLVGDDAQHFEVAVVSIQSTSCPLEYPVPPSNCPGRAVYGSLFVSHAYDEARNAKSTLSHGGLSGFISPRRGEGLGVGHLADHASLFPIRCSDGGRNELSGGFYSDPPSRSMRRTRRERLHEFGLEVSYFEFERNYPGAFIA